MQDIFRPEDLHPINTHLIFGADKHSSIIINTQDNFQQIALIKKCKEKYVIEALHPEAEVFINGVKIQSAEISINDRIQIAHRSFLITKYKERNVLQTYLSSANPKWQNQLDRIGNMAQSDLPVIIQGPSGTGKEMLAKIIHQFSKRKNGPIISVNCSSLSETLIGSELFGHRKGSFTDAKDNRAGAFEAAREGTLFLDEIGDLPLSLQPQILRALENKEIRPLGSDQIIKTDVRIVAATHQNLHKYVQQGKFREDLYYRLNILRLSPPPLIERMEDFEKLLFYFCREFQTSFSQKSIERLKRHQWHGNIRELKNVVSRAAALINDRRVNLSDLPILIDVNSDLNQLNVDLNEINVHSLKEIEKKMVIAALISSLGNQKIAAEKLGMARTTFNDKVKNYNIDIKDIVKKSLMDFI